MKNEFFIFIILNSQYFGTCQDISNKLVAQQLKTAEEYE